ncbi:biogenesis of lysosome-related organelles complex 1 subunit 6-like [Oppia nitens]|uniref:biogenesis of lysosome-related organelles complex 1 subunit 6-like n=1 Tax=Oppia nitens TaxID=1686743 RepID=UPI0023DBBFE8|nr:biogenesis of lysosome-related organelles complex 1 subunit 6-like [Oppia nitens]
MMSIKDMDELSRYQKSIVDSLDTENDKYLSANKDIDFDSLVGKGHHYYHKLLSIKKDMQSLTQKSHHLKQRALRLQANTSSQMESIEMEKYLQNEREKRLQPVMASNDISNAKT